MNEEIGDSYSLNYTCQWNNIIFVSNAIQVRKFLEETARWKREREREKEKKHSETDKLKKKKKKDKKGKEKDKDDKKSRKKKKKEERKKRKNKDKLERDLEALKKSSLPDLEQLESKLSAYYAKVEKETAVLKRFDSHWRSTITKNNNYSSSRLTNTLNQ